GLAAAGAPEPDHVPCLCNEVERVVQRMNRLAIESGLTTEGVGLEGPDLGQARALESLLAGIVAFEAVFLLHDMSEEGGVRHALTGGFLEILLPVRRQAGETEVSEL